MDDFLENFGGLEGGKFWGLEIAFECAEQALADYTPNLLVFAAFFAVLVEGLKNVYGNVKVERYWHLLVKLIIAIVFIKYYRHWLGRVDNLVRLINYRIRTFAEPRLTYVEELSFSDEDESWWGLITKTLSFSAQGEYFLKNTVFYCIAPIFRLIVRFITLSNILYTPLAAVWSLIPGQSKVLVKQLQRTLTIMFWLVGAQILNIAFYCFAVNDQTGGFGTIVALCVLIYLYSLIPASFAQIFGSSDTSNLLEGVTRLPAQALTLAASPVGGALQTYQGGKQAFSVAKTGFGILKQRANDSTVFKSGIKRPSVN